MEREEGEHKKKKKKKSVSTLKQMCSVLTARGNTSHMKPPGPSSPSLLEMETEKLVRGQPAACARALT